MSRYIDADKIHQFVDDKVAEGKDGWAKGVPYEWAYALTVIDNAPTADVVEVVRCKDCAYCRPYNDGKLYCHKKADIFVPIVDAHDYCSSGERREK